MLILNSIRLKVKIIYHRGKVGVRSRVTADQAATFICLWVQIPQLEYKLHTPGMFQFPWSYLFFILSQTPLFIYFDIFSG